MVGDSARASGSVQATKFGHAFPGNCPEFLQHGRAAILQPFLLPPELGKLSLQALFTAKLASSDD